jgi:excisionase family DNA binding protein
MSRTILKTPPTQKGIEQHYQPPGPPREVDGPPTKPVFERLYTIRQAAEITGLKYWLLQRAVKSGDVPSYSFGNKRRRVRLADIEAAIALAGETRGRTQ